LDIISQYDPAAIEATAAEEIEELAEKEG